MDYMLDEMYVVFSMGTFISKRDQLRELVYTGTLQILTSVVKTLLAAKRPASLEHVEMRYK